MSDTIHELKPCPFCGGAGEVHPSALGAFTRMAFVKCVECGCQSLASHYDNPAFMPQHIVKAAENWNNRPAELELTEARAEIERLKQELRDNSTQAARQIVPAEMLVDDLTAEIERKNETIDACSIMLRARETLISKQEKLIEQMRDALNVLVASATPSGPLWHGSAEMQIARAALSAAGRMEKK